jgi:polysaccharide biosynthesis/export protein
MAGRAPIQHWAELRRGTHVAVKIMALLQVFTLSGCGNIAWMGRGEPAKMAAPPSVASPGPSPPVPVPAAPAVPPPSPPVPEPVVERPPLQTAPIPSVPAIAPVPAAAKADYILGEEDEVEISVYGNADLSKTQSVRPGGYITFPLAGTIEAKGLTPEQLRVQISDRIAKFVRDPQVTVIVRAYNSRKISVLGEVKAPGLLRLASDIKLLEALSRAGGIAEDADLQSALVMREHQLVPVDFVRLLRQGDVSQNIPIRPGDAILIPSVKDKKVFVLGQVSRPLVLALTPGLSLIESLSRAGGLTEDADLQGALVLRGGRPLPVSFTKLMRLGDASQNVLLQANDTVLVPNIKDKKVYVLGEVKTPLVVTLKPGTTLIESLSMAGGFTRDARKSNVLLVRGGLGDPKLITIDVDEIVDGAPGAANALLEPGDIIYVPKTIMSNVVRFFQDITTILTPFVLVESGIILGPLANQVLTTGTTTTNQSIVVNPR